MNDSPDAINFSWEMTTTPIAVTGFKPTSHIEIDSTKVDSTKLTALENMLYGAENVDPALPLPNQLVTMFSSSSTTGATGTT